MATTTVRTAPKTLNEWTLETNINSELTRMFDSPFGFMYPVRLQKIFDILPFDITKFKPRKTKIYKLTPIEENKGGGWDEKYVIPRGLYGDSRVIYVQYKSGTHSDGNNITGSIFNFNLNNPNPNIEFTFNDNGKPKKGKLATQHEDLKRLNDYLVSSGCCNNSVLYGFPRISSLQQFENLNDDLILHTTFLSHTVMDAEARAAGVNLYDGLTHAFRSCYKNEKRREISSSPFLLESHDHTSEVLFEIMAVKLSHLWNELHEFTNESILIDSLTIAVCEYLRINPYQIIDNPISRDIHSDKYKSYFKDIEERRKVTEFEFLGQLDRGISQETRINLFKSLYQFFSKRSFFDININSEIPANYTSRLAPEYINGSVLNNELSLGDINISAIVF